MKDGAILANAGPLRRRDRPRRAARAAAGAPRGAAARRGVRRRRPAAEPARAGPRRQPRRRRGPSGRGDGPLVRDARARGRGPRRAAASSAPGVHAGPGAIDREVARLKLAALGVEIDELTPSRARTGRPGSGAAREIWPRPRQPARRRATPRAARGRRQDARRRARRGAIATFAELLRAAPGRRETRAARARAEIEPVDELPDADELPGRRATSPSCSTARS